MFDVSGFVGRILAPSCFLAILLFASSVSAAKLQADLTQPGLRARNNAPIPVNVRFQWDGTHILEGRLEVELCEGNRVLCQYRSGDLALTTGEQNYHMFLPPCITPYSDSQVEARMKFVTADGALDLDPSSLFMPAMGQRSMVLAWCNPRTAMATPDFEQTMMLERFVPESSDASGQRLPLTTLVRLAPEDLLAQPLAYTAYDVMVLTGDAFSEANESQLQALARWVKGGGSVCVFAAGGLQEHHLAFLNELADSAGAPAFLADKNGFLLPGEKKIWSFHSGLGRTLIVTGTIGTDIQQDSPEWKRAAAFLWKVRDERLQVSGTAAQSSTATNETGEVAPTTIEEYASQFPTYQQAASRPRARMPLTLDAIDQALTLTDVEKPKVKAALDELSAARNAVRNEVRQMAQGPNMAQPSDARQKMLAAMQAYDAKMKGILTADQYKKFQATSIPNRALAAPQVPLLSVQNGGFSSYGSPYGIQPSVSMLGGELLSRLMPTTVRLIPFHAILVMLVLFLMLVGPADYFVLGFLRRRRYTWILFPAMSLSFMLATVLMANHYLGLHDQRRSLVVVDLDKDGTALRWNQYELVFAARDKVAVTELKDALWTHLSTEEMPMMIPGAPNPGVPTRVYNNGRALTYTYAYGYTPGYPARVPGREAGLPWYEGVVPVHFRTSEPINQWQPQLNRIFSFEPPPAPLLANWTAVEQAWPDLQNIRAKLQQPFIGDVCAISTSLYSPYQANTAFDSGSIHILPESILSELCLSGSAGLLSIVSQISPTGGQSFDDVPALDSDAGDRALVIVTQRGDDIIVYRRFFHGN